MSKRTLHLHKEVLTELGAADLGLVAGAAPPPTIPETQCTICKSFLPTCVVTCICLD
jgi:hypothetical protein